MLSVRRLVVNENIEEVSLFLEEGQCLSLEGPAGSGKSLLFSVLAGAQCPKKGNVSVYGHHLYGDPYEGQKARAHLGSVFDVPGLLSNLDVEGNIDLVLKAHLPDLADKERAERKFSVLEEFGIRELAKKRPVDLSRATLFRASLARAFSHGPKVFLWDCPFQGIEEAFVIQMQTKLDEYLRSGGSVIFSSAHTKDLEGFDYQVYELGTSVKEAA